MRIEAIITLIHNGCAVRAGISLSRLCVALEAIGFACLLYDTRPPCDSWGACVFVFAYSTRIKPLTFNELRKFQLL